MTIISGTISFVIVLGLISLPEPEVGLINFDEMIEAFTETYNYVQENTNHAVTEREYYMVMRLASSDPDNLNYYMSILLYVFHVYSEY